MKFGAFVSALFPLCLAAQTLPAPSGPFAIGRIAHHWTDPSRHESHSTDPNAHRELMVYLWYPGHSAGAEYAARACQLDARFRACVDLDGGMVPVAALPISNDGATMKVPLLFLEAYHPESTMGGLPHERIAEYYKTREEQLQNCPRGTYAVVLRSEGIAHPSFSDIPIFFAGRDEYPTTAVALRNLELIEHFIRAFLDKTLKGGNTPLLDGGSAPIPEATVQKYGR